MLPLSSVNLMLLTGIQWIACAKPQWTAARVRFLFFGGMSLVVCACVDCLFVLFLVFFDFRLCVCTGGSHHEIAGHWIFFAIDVDFVPSATLYNSLAANRDWLVSVAPSGY